MSISVEHFRPDPIMIVSFLTTEDIVEDQRQAWAAVHSYQQRMGGRVIAIWDTTLTDSPLSSTFQVGSYELAHPDGLTTIIVDGADHPHAPLDSPHHRVTTREDAINLAYAIQRHEVGGDGFFFAAR